MNEPEKRRDWKVRLRPSVIKRMKEGCLKLGRTQQFVMEEMVNEKFLKKGGRKL